MGYKITGFLIAIVLIGLFVGVAGLFLSDLNDNYDFAYDNTSLDVYNKFDNISDTAGNIKDEVGEIKEQTGVIDVIGGFFSSAYNSLKIVGQSFSAFEGITEQAGQDMPIGAAGFLIKNALIVIMLIIIFIGILLAVVLKVKGDGL